jgi:hypothetical protein
MQPFSLFSSVMEIQKLESHCLVRANVAVSPVRGKSSLINFHQSFRSDPENIPSNHTIEPRRCNRYAPSSLGNFYLSRRG